MRCAQSAKRQRDAEEHDKQVAERRAAWVAAGKHPHALQHFMDPVAAAPAYAGGYKCDVCGESKATDMWHCQTEGCGFDACMACTQWAPSA